MIKTKVNNVLRRCKGLLGAVAVLSPLVGLAIYSEQHNIGSYRPEGLMEGYTSYVAYEYPNCTRLYMPAIPGMVSGPIIDKGNDGIIDAVGTLTYPRMPVPMDILKIGTEEKRNQSRERYQDLFDRVMSEIRKPDK